jgi:hypothetical protein
VCLAHDELLRDGLLLKVRISDGGTHAQTEHDRNQASHDISDWERNRGGDLQSSQRRVYRQAFRRSSENARCPSATPLFRTATGRIPANGAARRGRTSLTDRILARTGPGSVSLASERASPAAHGVVGPAGLEPATERL